MWIFLALALGSGCASHLWRPGPAAVAAAKGAVVRALHREQKSNAFFHFLDEDVEQRVYATPTETEADAVDVTGLVTGYNVQLMEALADAGGWTVRFYVMCASGYPCAKNMSRAPLPADDLPALGYLQANTTFDCVVTSTPMHAAIVGSADFLSPPTLSTGMSAWAKVPEPPADARIDWDVKRLTSWRRPFSNGVWLFLALVFLVAGFCYGNVFADEGSPGVESAANGVFQSIASYTGAGGFEPRTGKGKVFVALFSFFTLLVVSAYTANLTSFLTVGAIDGQPVKRIGSFAELGLRPCFYGKSTEAWLAENHPAVRGVDVASLPGFDGTKERYCQLFAFLRTGECDGAVLLAAYGRSLFVRDECRDNRPTACDVEPAGPEEGAVYYGIPWRYTDGPLRAAHAWVLADLADAGEVLALADRYFPTHPLDVAGCKRGDDDDEAIQYEMADMIGYFFIAVAAVAFGFLGYVAEKAAAALSRRFSRGAVAPEVAAATVEMSPAVVVVDDIEQRAGCARRGRARDHRRKRQRPGRRAASESPAPTPRLCMC